MELHYVVIRYMLNELADEAANVGLVAAGGSPPQIIPKFLDNPAIKSRQDARVQREVVDRFVEHLKAIQGRIEANTSESDLLSIFEQLREYNSGLLRTTVPRVVVTNDIQREVDVLFEQWVAPRVVPSRPSVVADETTQRKRDPLGGLKREARTAIMHLFRKGYGRPARKALQTNFEVKGLKHTSVMDLAFRSPTTPKREHLFHHVLLLPSAEETFNQAAGLSCRWIDITARNHVQRDLTAVLYKRPGAVKGVEDAIKLLTDSNVYVSQLDELPKLAAKLKDQPDLIID